ncbi:MAG: metal-dependent hydrolase [Phormidesmis sp.]
MPSPIAHAVTGYALTHIFSNRLKSRNNLKHSSSKGPLKGPKSPLKRSLRGLYPLLSPLAIYAIVVSILPDLDFLPQLITQQRFHRGPTHSLFIGFLLSFLLSVMAQALFKKIGQSGKHKSLSYKTLFTFTFSLYLTHLCLDSVTVGGPGMKFLWPLSDRYLRAPFSLFPGVHHSRGLWDNSHLIFITIETLYSIVLISILKVFPTRPSYRNQPIEK